MIQFKTALAHEAMVAVTQSLFLTIWFRGMIFFGMAQNGISCFLIGLFILVRGMISLSVILDKEYQYDRLPLHELKTLGLADLTVIGLIMFIPFMTCLCNPRLCEEQKITHQRTSPAVEYLLIILCYSVWISSYRATSYFVHYGFKWVFGIVFGIGSADRE